MAAKAAVAAALVAAAMVALASATMTVRTTTISMDEGGNPWKKILCRQQLQGRDFSSCQRYLSPYGHGGVLEMITGNQQQQQVEECCEELRELDRFQCGCEAIKRVVQQAQHQGGTETYETGTEGQSHSQQIYQKASSLPRMCRLREQQCQIQLLLV